MTRTRPPQPQVSVIVPVYNQERYLEECISSIRRQTLAEWECLIINDGSSDSSGEIARRFSEADSRIRYFEQKNGGVSSARNLGMRRASGRYLCFVDGDDFIDAAFLKHLLDASDRGASDLTVAGKLFCDRFPPDKIPALPTCGIFLRREFPLKNNLEFPEGIHPCEDGLFSHFVLALTEKISFCPEAVYHYREETDWITAIHSEKGQARILLIGDSVMRHLWRPLASELQEDIDLFSSTLIPGDPDYLPTLAGYFPSAGYEAVIVSFGSHVTNKVSAISVDDFRKNYMAFVSQLSKRCRFLILATSTSIMDGPDGTLNEEKEKIITAFNAIVREAASSLPGAVLSDHHDFMQGAQYIDPFHFSPPDRAYQAGKTAGLLLPLLSARQEPPKEQECPKSRPEP